MTRGAVAHLAESSRPCIDMPQIWWNRCSGMGYTSCLEFSLVRRMGFCRKRRQKWKSCVAAVEVVHSGLVILINPIMTTPHDNMKQRSGSSIRLFQIEHRRLCQHFYRIRPFSYFVDSPDDETVPSRHSAASRPLDPHSVSGFFERPAERLPIPPRSPD